MFRQANAPDPLVATKKVDPPFLSAVASLDFVDGSIVNVALPSIRLLGAEPAVGDHLNLPAPKGA
jgi:hypothetical protein